MGGASPLPALLLFPHCHCEGASRPWQSVFLFVVSDGLFSFSSEKGAFRAPARGTFALGGKSTQKRRSNLRFENPSRAFTYRLSRLFSPRERHAAQISSKCCIVSASLFAAALALKCRAVQLWRKLFLNGGHRPPPTFAAKRQRRDLIIALPGVGVSKGEGRSPPLLVVSRLGDFQGGREIEIPSPLNGVLWLLSFDKERK